MRFAVATRAAEAPSHGGRHEWRWEQEGPEVEAISLLELLAAPAGRDRFEQRASGAAGVPLASFAGPVSRLGHQREGVDLSLRQRITDYLRERRIQKLADDIEHARELRAYCDKWSREAWDEMAREIQMRSQDQIARMETAKGLRP